MLPDYPGFRKQSRCAQRGLPEADSRTALLGLLPQVLGGMPGPVLQLLDTLSPPAMAQLSPVGRGCVTPVRSTENIQAPGLETTPQPGAGSLFASLAAYFRVSSVATSAESPLKVAAVTPSLCTRISLPSSAMAFSP